MPMIAPWPDQAGDASGWMYLLSHRLSCMGDSLSRKVKTAANITVYVFQPVVPFYLFEY